MAWQLGFVQILAFIFRISFLFGMGTLGVLADRALSPSIMVFHNTVVYNAFEVLTQLRGGVVTVSGLLGCASGDKGRLPICYVAEMAVRVIVITFIVSS
jgi:hypothetical protein